MSVFPKQYQKNAHARYTTRVEGGTFVVEYIFRDHWDKTRKAVLRFDEERMREDIDRFGIPPSWFNPLTREQRRRLAPLVKEGFFRVREGVIEIDYAAAVAYYAPGYGKPIAESIVTTLAAEGCDTRMNRIEFAMKFVQDIPYGIPEFRNSSRYMGGAMPPPLTLRVGFGDCDTKTMLFLSILCYLVPAGDIVILQTYDHVLSAVRSEKQPVDNACVWYLEIAGGKYYLTETAGPARLGLGQETLRYSSFRVDRLEDAWNETPPVLPQGKMIAGVQGMRRQDGSGGFALGGDDSREGKKTEEWRKKKEEDYAHLDEEKPDPDRNRRRRDDSGGDSWNGGRGVTIPRPRRDGLFFFRVGAGLRWDEGDIASFSRSPSFQFESRRWVVTIAAGFSMSGSSALEISATSILAPVGGDGSAGQGAAPDGNVKAASWEAALSLTRHGFLRYSVGYGEENREGAPAAGSARPYFLAGAFVRVKIFPVGLEAGAEAVKPQGGGTVSLRLAVNGSLYFNP